MLLPRAKLDTRISAGEEQLVMGAGMAQTQRGSQKSSYAVVDEALAENLLSVCSSLAINWKR